MYKNLIYVPTKDMTRDEWLQERRKSIGGSDVSAILGFSKYASKFSLWAEKTGKYIPEDISDKECVRLGNDLEQYVAERWMEATGKRVRRCNYMIRNPDYPFAHADVDRLVVSEDSGLEIKTSSSFEIAKQCRDGEIPSVYYAQVVAYLAITGAERWYLAVLCFGVGLFMFTIERDEEEISALLAAERDFWELVKNDTPPAPDGSNQTTDAITSAFPNSRDSDVDLSSMESLFDERKALKEQADAIDNRICEIENIIKNQMQDAERAACGSWHVSWKSNSRNTFQAKQFAADHPDIDLSRYYKSTTVRPFKVTFKEASNAAAE